LLKLVTGNPGKRDIKPEPVPSSDFTLEHRDAKRLTQRQRELLADLVRDMPPSLYKSVDAGALILYAHSYERFLDCIARIDSSNLLVKADNGFTYKFNPFIKLSRYFADDMLRAASELGCTPSARARLGAAQKGKNEDEDDPFARLAGDL
jgi:P27 family predicted phage terminase small subunit